MKTPMKSCRNCFYRHGSVELGRCLLSGEYTSITRTFDHNNRCDKDWSGWVKRPGLLRRVWWWLCGLVW